MSFVENRVRRGDPPMAMPLLNMTFEDAWSARISGSASGSIERTGEHRLAFAVLEEGVRDVLAFARLGRVRVTDGRHPQRIARLYELEQLLAWLRGTHRDVLHSFEWCCDLFDLNHEWMRDRLLAMLGAPGSAPASVSPRLLRRATGG